MARIVVDPFGAVDFSRLTDEALEASLKALKTLSNSKVVPAEYKMRIYANHGNAADEMKRRGLK